MDLVDTPGLVDGNVAYPFDVNRVIAEMADIVDLILVFLDPQGQALCSRTMEVVEDLNVRHAPQSATSIELSAPFTTLLDLLAKR